MPQAELTPESIEAKLADYDKASIGFDLMANMLGSVINTLAKVEPDLFNDQTAYTLVRQALPRAVEAQGGPEFVEAILAVAITRSIRQQRGVSGG